MHLRRHRRRHPCPPTFSLLPPPRPLKNQRHRSCRTRRISPFVPACVIPSLAPICLFRPNLCASPSQEGRWGGACIRPRCHPTGWLTQTRTRAQNFKGHVRVCLYLPVCLRAHSLARSSLYGISNLKR